MTILSTSDTREISNTWVARKDDAFRQAIEDVFVDYMMSNIPIDLKNQLVEAANVATSPQDIRVPFGDVRYVLTETFRANGWGTREMTVSDAIFNTNALSRIAREIGDNIRIQKHFTEHSVFFTIEFEPAYARIPNPEDQYADMPTMDDF